MDVMRTTTIAAFAIGGVVGLWHLDVAATAIFVFRENEPATSWLAVALGPGVTLLGVVIAAVRRNVGGVFLIVASLAATVAFVAGENGNFENVVPFLTRITAPMIFLGSVFVALASKPIRQSESHAT